MTESTDFREAPFFTNGPPPVSHLAGESNGLKSNGAEVAEEEEERNARLKAVPPEMLKEYYFGCGPLRPKWLQVFARKKVFTILLCGFAFLQGAIVSGEL